MARLAMEDEMTTVIWTRPMLERFKKAYKQAASTTVDTFLFDNNEYVVDYAKYLIEYLETEYGTDHQRQP